MSFISVKGLLTASLALSLLSACSKEDKKTSGFDLLNDPNKPANCSANKGSIEKPTFIRSDYAKDEINRLCAVAIEKAGSNLNKIVQIPAQQRNFNNTLLNFETILANLSDETTPLLFMGYVSTDEDMRSEGAACEEKVGQFHTEIFTKKDLYEALKDSVGRNDEEKRLASETLKGFIKSGLNLNDADLNQVKLLTQQLNTLQTKYQENLNNDTTQAEFSADELEGTSADFLNRLKKSDAGKYVVTTKTPDYVEVMENAKSSDTRKRMLSTYENRQAEANTKLLESAVLVRQQIAKLMGYKTWADYQLDGRMAKDVPTVLDFLHGLKEKLSQRNQADQKKFLDYKKTLDPSATKLNAWDLRYLDSQLKRHQYSLDEELIREYFPAQTVIAGLFNVYSQLLGVKYVQVKDASVWNPDVQLFEIRNKSDDRLIGYFYADLIPREGKYEHAAAFPLISGRISCNGYSYPVAAIVANLTPPSGDKPSLLSHDDVDTLFHEFGHIMHQTLTRAPYASLSGSSVAQDFVEAPSQMLENWVWNTDILASISGHYKDSSKKLPTDLLNKMIAARDFDQGYTYTRQLLFALFDMSIHSQNGPVDVTETYRQMHIDIVGLEPVEGSHFAASFGHMMGGYDAGYYGYLWSEVYAADMFTKFENAPGKLLDENIGVQYRQEILEKGGMKDPLELLASFLGRLPNSDAFFKKLGITN